MGGKTRQAGLRQLRSGDDEFCYQLHRGALGEYVEAIWGWDEPVQRAYHEKTFDAARTQIITVDGQDAGVLVVDDTGPDVVLGRIELEPHHQGRGVGAHVVAALVAEAASRGRGVVLEVLDVNPRARAFYERLGFRETGRPRPHKIAMRHHGFSDVVGSPST
ncbi:MULTISPECIES: GNAT family N-acetyltransferase [unclassified Amycolatopsis]|uniref:GNAT family N-acetyltransferase n=1 Tax=unclassified Amycolatopsis TaxID=2618356 RepID=UPI002E1216A8|nr:MULTISPECIES: GNAT family N-acetyltransferase [unclassified Amycolatopsis]WSK83624.1 GNAT family N-acetyltransferase [Amycolatopsis sp. NBC_01286]